MASWEEYEIAGSWKREPAIVRRPLPFGHWQILTFERRAVLGPRISYLESIGLIGLQAVARRRAWNNSRKACAVTRKSSVKNWKLHADKPSNNFVKFASVLRIFQTITHRVSKNRGSENIISFIHRLCHPFQLSTSFAGRKETALRRSQEEEKTRNPASPRHGSSFLRNSITAAKGASLKNHCYRGLNFQNWRSAFLESGSKWTWKGRFLAVVLTLS